MSLLTVIDDEFAKAESSLGDVIGFFTGKAKEVLKAKVAELEADEAKFKAEIQDAVAKAKAAALAEVEANSPAAAAEVAKALTALESAIVSALEAHLVP